MGRVIDEMNYQGPSSPPPRCEHGVQGGGQYGCHDCNRVTRTLDSNGSMRYIERSDGSRDWVDYRDVEGWE